MINANYLVRNVSKLTLLFATTLLLLTSCSSDDDATDLPGNGNGEGEIVVIEDDMLRQIILETLNLTSADQITTQSMENLIEINLVNSTVESLNGLENAINLERFLAASANLIEDYSPLSELLSITHVDLDRAGIEGNETVEFLGNLNNLEFLDLREAAITDISFLSGKNNLKHLNLRQTSVTDISPIEGLNELQYLNLNRAGNGDGIDNPEVTISMNKLYYLSLRNTFIGDEIFAQIFANKDQMVELNIRNTGITSVAPLVPLFESEPGAFSVELSELYENKRSLDLQGNEIEDLCLLEPFLDLFDENNEFEWSPALAGDFNDCDGDGPDLGEHDFIEDEALLQSILNELGFSDYQELTEESILNLTELDIRGTAVTSLVGLDKALNLEDLNARDTEISDITPLADLENLLVLNLRQSAVSDISALEGMTQLQYLNLNRAGNGDGIINPEIIEPMVNLYYLNLRNTALTNQQFEMFENFDQLVECNVRNTGITSIASLAVAFENGAFTQALADQYGNSLSLDLQNNDIDDLCLIADFVDVFPAGELEWSGSFSFEDCE